MKINNVEMTVSAVRRSQYPIDDKPEFMLVGRSNVGKSSFINTIIHRKNFARTSARPGKTQTLNFYLVNDEFYFVDVPGYGYAAVNKEQQKKFGMMIEDYIKNRSQLRTIFMLVDFRHKPTEDDVLMYNFLKHFEIPVILVATKIDKVSKNAREKQKRLIKDSIDLVLGDELVLFSSVSKEGKLEIQEKLDRLISI